MVPGKIRCRLDALVGSDRAPSAKRDDARLMASGGWVFLAAILFQEIPKCRPTSQWFRRVRVRLVGRVSASWNRDEVGRNALSTESCDKTFRLIQWNNLIRCSVCTKARWRLGMNLKKWRSLAFDMGVVFRPSPEERCDTIYVFRFFNSPPGDVMHSAHRDHASHGAGPICVPRGAQAKQCRQVTPGRGTGYAYAGGIKSKRSSLAGNPGENRLHVVNLCRMGSGSTQSVIRKEGGKTRLDDQSSIGLHVTPGSRMPAAAMNTNNDRQRFGYPIRQQAIQ